MALSAVTISLGVDFQSNNAAIVLTNNADLIAQGVALADAVGVVTVRSPMDSRGYGDLAGTVCWDFDVSLLNAIPIVFPKDANGVFVTGTYYFDVTIKDTATSATITQTVSAVFCNDAPYPDVELTFNCLCDPLVTAVDSTPYFPPNETAWTITARTLTLYGPQGTSWATTLSTQDRIGTGSSSAWSGTYEAKLEITIQRTISGVTETCTRTETFKGVFECISACQLKCLLSTAWDRTLTAKASDIAKQEHIYQKVASRVTHFAQSQDCGDGDTMARLVTEIKRILNVTDDCCGCGDSQPTLITALCGGSGSTVTITQGPWLDVTGSHPNFTIGVNAAGQSVLTNSKNTVVVAGARATVTGPVNTGSNPSTDTYTVIADLQEPEMIQVEFTLNFAGTGIPNGAAFTSFNEARYGTAFTAFSSWTKTMQASATSDPADFELTGYLTSPAGNDQVIRSAEVTGIDTSTRGLPYTPIAGVYYQDRSAFSYNSRIDLKWPWGSLMTIDDIRALGISNIYIRVGLTIK